VITAPSDVGFYLPSGAMSLILDLSYENLSASVVNDQSGVELCITRTPRSKVAGMLLATYSLINIPPGTTNYSVMGNCIAQVTSPSFIIGAAPIMHGIGTHSRLSLTGGVVLFDAAFTVDNQPWYPVSDKPIQNGEKLLWSCTYSNPSSSAVTLGEGTRNEFCAMAVAYYPRGGVACQESLGGIFGN
jgi:hypothetical protein